MDGIKDFLESSTIHGLVYISTTRTPLSKVLWIGVVIGGFITAGVLINSSFTEWEKSPIATTIEKYPISKVVFPSVTVCPPQGTNTVLNSDLQKAENATLDKNVRDELVKLAGEWLHDNEFREIYEEVDAFKEEHKFRNLYMGYSSLNSALDVHPLVVHVLLHGAVILEQHGVPFLLCHLTDVEWGVKVYMANLCKEIFAVEGWYARIWK